MSEEKSELLKNVEIFSTDDYKLKIFADIISIDASRKILNMLFKNEMTANEIAEKVGLSLQLAKYHLDKMQRIDLVYVSKIEKNSKARDMNYYKASKFAIVITPSEVTEKAKQSKLLRKSFNSIYRFFGAGLALAASAFSIMLVGSEGRLLDAKQLYSGLVSSINGIKDTALPNKIEESLFLAKTKVEMVRTHPGEGSGTPFLDPYSSALPFETGDFVVTMLVIAGIGCILSLPFFLKSYQFSKMMKHN